MRNCRGTPRNLEVKQVTDFVEQLVVQTFVSAGTGTLCDTQEQGDLPPLRTWKWLKAFLDCHSRHVRQLGSTPPRTVQGDRMVDERLTDSIDEVALNGVGHLGSYRRTGSRSG